MKKNVIMICIDGGRVDFAKHSSILQDYLPGTIFFSNSITYAPYTNSSVHAVISGCYGNRNGCDSYWNSANFDLKNFKTLMLYLKAYNYRTVADVISDLLIPQTGFDQYVIYDEDKVDLSSRHTKLLEKINNESTEKFFIFLHYEGIHTTIKNHVLRPFNNFSQEYFDAKEQNKKRYASLFENAEMYLKKIFDKILELQLDENSLIIIFSDHGTSIGEKFGERAYGAYCYDYTIKTFVSLITHDFEKKEIKQQVRHIDILPTILEKLDIPLDQNFEKLDGTSLLPLLNGNKMLEQVAYTETGNPLKDNKPPKKPNTKSIRYLGWKFIYNEYNNSKELYNLVEDPDEKNNLSDTGIDIEKKLWQELLKHQI